MVNTPGKNKKGHDEAPSTNMVVLHNIPPHDLRHSILREFRSAMNGGNTDEFKDLFERYCRDEMTMHYKYMGINSPHAFSEMLVAGRVASLAFWTSAFKCTPDLTFQFIGNTTFSIRSGGVESVGVMNCIMSGTKTLEREEALPDETRRSIPSHITRMQLSGMANIEITHDGSKIENETASTDSTRSLQSHLPSCRVVTAAAADQMSVVTENSDGTATAVVQTTTVGSSAMAMCSDHMPIYQRAPELAVAAATAEDITSSNKSAAPFSKFYKAAKTFKYENYSSISFVFDGDLKITDIVIVLDSAEVEDPSYVAQK
jgi:DNA-directed RNA polymerase beta' subunit